MLAATLSACGGAGTPSVTDPPPGKIPTPVGGGGGGSASGGPEKRTAAAALVTEYAPSLPIAYTALSAVPTSGSATYQGYYYGEIADTSQNLIGDLRMVANFNGSSVGISGSVLDIYDAGDNAVSGTLSLSNGSLDRSGDPAGDATLSADVTGTLTTSSQSIVIGAQLEGDFLGAVYDAVGGAVLGSATINGTRRNFDGGFIAEK